MLKILRHRAGLLSVPHFLGLRKSLFRWPYALSHSRTVLPPAIVLLLEDNTQIALCDVTLDSTAQRDSCYFLRNTALEGNE